MSDYISRQAAIDGKISIQRTNGVEMYSGEAVPVEYLKALPPAQPETEEGEWIPEFNGKFIGGAYWFSCSKCKRIVPEVRNGGWNFCPTCGAKMDGGKNT